MRKLKSCYSANRSAKYDLVATGLPKRYLYAELPKFSLLVFQQQSLLISKLGVPIMRQQVLMRRMKSYDVCMIFHYFLTDKFFEYLINQVKCYSFMSRYVKGTERNN